MVMEAPCSFLLIDESINFVLYGLASIFWGRADAEAWNGAYPQGSPCQSHDCRNRAAGSLDVTVSQIAKRAGMSSALAHHYFGSKEEMFLAAMRHILTLYGAEVRGALAAAEGPEGRIKAILRASFSPGNFRREAVGAWLNFWVLAQTVPTGAAAAGGLSGAAAVESHGGAAAAWRGAAPRNRRLARRADRRALPARGAEIRGAGRGGRGGAGPAAS
jgi:AcrR family transcriptional regulator